VKPVIIIAIAVVCSVIAVYGIMYVPESITESIMKSSIESQEQSIVDAFNKETGRCRTVFGDLSSKEQCEVNAIKKFEIYKLSVGSFQKLESAFTEEERLQLDTLYEMQEILGNFNSPDSIASAVEQLERYKIKLEQNP